MIFVNFSIDLLKLFFNLRFDIFNTDTEYVKLNANCLNVNVHLLYDCRWDNYKTLYSCIEIKIRFVDVSYNIYVRDDEIKFCSRESGFFFDTQSKFETASVCHRLHVILIDKIFIITRYPNRYLKSKGTCSIGIRSATTTLQ